MKAKIHKLVKDGKAWHRCVLLHVKILRGKACTLAGSLAWSGSMYPERLSGEVLPQNSLLEGWGEGE